MKRDACERSGAGGGHVRTRRSPPDGHVLRDNDQLGPASVVDGRIDVHEEAEDLVAGVGDMARVRPRLQEPALPERPPRTVRNPERACRYCPRR
jgi:hypothetical protein